MSDATSLKACPLCGESIKEAAIKCRYCGSYLDGRTEENDDAALRMILPVGRSGWAIASGYFGLLSLFPLVGLLFGILAIYTGIKALKEIRAKPKLGGKGRAIFGIIMGLIFSIIYAITGLILLIGFLVYKR